MRLVTCWACHGTGTERSTGRAGDPLEVTCWTCQGAGRLIERRVALLPGLLGLALAGIVGAIVGAVLTFAITTGALASTPRPGQDVIPAPPNMDPHDPGQVGSRTGRVPARNPDRTAAPSSPAPGPSSATGTRPATTKRPATVKPSRALLRGVATWHATGRDGMYGAAGPLLRRALGSHWRGTRVTVCHASRCTRIVLNDWCLCSRDRRLVDLSDEAFRRLAPLSRGVVRVTVSR